MFDCHSPCIHSHDSPTPIDVMIEKAIEKGMKYMAFTDHLDRDYLHDNSLDEGEEQLDIEFHILDTLRAKEKYKDKIQIACGVECGYSKASEQDYVNILSKYQFDIILNSVHSIGGIDCYYSQFFEGKSKREAYCQYLSSILDSVNAPYDFDVITHIGYICRKAPFENRDMNYSEYSDMIDSILKAIIEKDLSLEINTHNRGINTPFLPYSSIVDRYIELGGKEFTFGSDAHRIDRVCDKFEVVSDYLLNKNINYLNIYKNRQKIKVKI